MLTHLSNNLWRRQNPRLENQPMCFQYMHKKGMKCDPQNNHPISLTSIVGKTMEHILTSQIMRHLELNKNSLQVDIGILDFSKAFDKVANANMLLKINFTVLEV